MARVSLSLHDEMQLMAEELRRHFSPSQLERLARETGFIQRQRKLRAQDFVTLAAFLNHDLATYPLTALCGELDAARQVSLSAEGLNQRFDESSVAFLRKLFSTLLEAKLLAAASLPCDLDRYFQRIRILDATLFQLPDRFAPRYPGSGGSAHTAGMKIQFEFDLKTGRFLYVDVGSGSMNDGLKGTERTQTVTSGDLCIRDLGYFCLKDFQQMEQQGAFYLSRLKINVRVYEKNEAIKHFKNGKVKKESLFTEIDLESIMNQMKLGEIIEIEKAYLGRNSKYATRLLIYKLTEEQTQERLAIRFKNEKKKGITYREKTKRLSAINVYMTNIPPTTIAKEQIYPLYSLRWQVEILFKTWKSLFHIDAVKPVKIERFECQVYGKLIALLLTSSLMFQMREILLRKKKQELSELKAMAILKSYLGKLYDTVDNGMEEMVELLQRVFQMIAKNGRKSHRYEKKTVFDLLGIVYESRKKIKATAS